MLKLRAGMMAWGVLLLMFGCMSVTACGAQQGSGKEQAQAPEEQRPAATPETPLPTPTTPAREGERVTTGGEMKVLAGGMNGSVDEAFVAVVRDAQTYAALRAVVGQLPEMNAEAFKTNAVVAAFLGMRRTGGYGVEITRTGEDTLRFAETTPPKGAITSQALTAPFKVVSVALNEQASLKIETGEAWTRAMRPYRVKEGEFESSGGFAGRGEKFALGGELRIGRLGKLVSVVFMLKTTGDARARALQTIATGTTTDAHSFTVPRLEGGSLVEWPNGGLRATGRFNGNAADNLTLSFDPLPSIYSDGFNGTGKLEAIATAPAPKKQPRSDDAPM